MLTIPTMSLVLLLAAAFVVGIVVYDLVVTLLFKDSHSDRLMARRNFPMRLVVYGCLAVIGAGIWIFVSNWIAGVILIGGAIFAIVGIIWYSAAHKTS